MTPYRRCKDPTNTSAPWYIQVTVNGTKTQLNTKTSDYKKAIAVGQQYAAAHRFGVVLKADPMPASVTIQMILDIYLNQNLHTKQSTRRKNAAALRSIIASCGITTNAHPSVLTRQVLIKFQGFWMSTHPRGAVSANSYVQQARSIFGRRCMPLYEHLGDLSLDGFMRQPLLKPPRSEYTPPPEDSVQGLFAAANELKKTDPAAYAAFTLAVYTGLRAGEMVAARWDWMLNQKGTDYIRIPCENAKSNASRLVPIASAVVAELRSVSSGDYIIPGGTNNARLEAVYYRHSKWLAAHGMKRGGKTNHELRKYFGAMIASDPTKGLFVAQKLLGHSSPKITSDTYAALIQMPEPLPLRQSAS